MSDLFLRQADLSTALGSNGSLHTKSTSLLHKLADIVGQCVWTCLRRSIARGRAHHPSLPAHLHQSPYLWVSVLAQALGMVALGLVVLLRWRLALLLPPASRHRSKRQAF